LNKLTEYIRLLLIPISGIFFILIYFRNLFYKTGLFKITDVGVPVISIGNISSGGTGKSPLTLYIANYFVTKSKKVCIISRGFKRNSNEMTIVYNGKDLSGNITNTGDELMMIYEKLIQTSKDFYIIASADRINAALYAKNNFKIDLIILDDAFQHRKIKRDLDIVITDNYEHSLTEKLLLPAGNSRELTSALMRADLVICNYKFYPGNNDNYNISMQYCNKGYFNINGDTIDTKRKSVIAFCGIAKPESFLCSLNKCNIVDKIIYYDHKNYKESDINFLINKYQKDIIFITTEKDFVKIKEFHNFVSQFPVYFMKIDIEFVKGRDKFELKLNELLKL
jgi:tetraacyldisaccharide 4'-kinase